MSDYGDLREYKSTNPECLMSMQQFVAQREWHDDLDADLGVPAREGFAYPGGLYIEKVTDAWSAYAREQGDWYLILERDEFFGTLEELELRLYCYGAHYGYLDGVKPDPRPIN